MRRTMLAVPMMLLCLLCACRGKENTPMQAPLGLRAALNSGSGCRFTAEGTAEVEQRLYELSLSCRVRSDGTAEVRVNLPESIAGIEAETDGKTGRLRFDGLNLTFGLPDDERLSPLAMPAVLFRAWQEGYVVSAGPDGADVLAVYDFGAGDPVGVRTWFDTECTPLRAELLWMGRVCGRLEIKDFEQISGGNHETAEEDLG